MADEPPSGQGPPRFLPPEAPGGEPDLAATSGWPPVGAEQPGEQAPYPPPQYQQAPPPYQQPPPAYQQAPPGWQPPPPGWQPPPSQPQPWVYQPQPQVPDNGPAVAGFVLSVVSATLLVLSVGLSSVVSVVCSALGIFYSRRGRVRVDSGESPKHRGLAQAGFIVGWVSIGLSILAIVTWILIFAFEGSGDESIFDPDTTRALREAVGA